MKKIKNVKKESTSKKTNQDTKIIPPKKKKRFEIFIYNIWCKQCGICVSFCPNEVLGFDENQKLTALNPDACIGCGQCELRCPDYAIEIKEKEEE